MSERIEESGPIEGLVFAGGGARCFWQAGFLAEAAEALNVQPRSVAAVSAGSAIAAAVLTGRTHQALSSFKAATEDNPRNMYLRNLFRRGRRVFPHEAMYRAAVLEMIDAAALQRLHDGPRINIVLAQPPRWLGPRSAVLVGMGVYSVEKKFKRPVHPRACKRIGFKAKLVDVRDLPTPEALADAILCSSCTPPFTPLMRRDGRHVLDGGLVDVVPADMMPTSVERTLVLLSRPYPHGTPRHPGRIYVQPSEAVGVSKWDYTNPAGLQAAFDLGRRDGEGFVRSHRPAG